MARANRVMVNVKYFVPCADENHFALQLGAGKYVTVSGMVLRVGPESIRLRTGDGDRSIRFSDIREIRNEAGYFDIHWEMEAP